MIRLSMAESRATCPVCVSPAQLWVRLLNALLYRCSGCSHCFTHTDSITKPESYGTEYYFATHKNWFANPNIRLFSLLRSELRRRGVTTILDVGCGNGAFLKFVAAEDPNLDLDGIDLSGTTMSDSIAFHQGDFLEYKFEKQFDAIVSLAVIEHLSDVRVYVKRVHQLLNNHGVAYLMTLK